MSEGERHGIEIVVVEERRGEVGWGGENKRVNESRGVRASSTKSKVKREQNPWLFLNLPRVKNEMLRGRKASMGTGCTKPGSLCRCRWGQTEAWRGYSRCKVKWLGGGRQPHRHRMFFLYYRLTI